MPSLFSYALAALAEIGGCFVLGVAADGKKSSLWTIPGIASLSLFAMILTRIDTSYAGRTYAAY